MGYVTATLGAPGLLCPAALRYSPEQSGPTAAGFPMLIKSVSWLGACALAFLSFGAAASEVAWDAQGGASVVATVAPKAEHETCARLAAKDRVVWAFVAQGPVDFSIRDPRTKEVVRGSSQTGVREARDALESARAQIYCWAWINRGTTEVQVSLQLRKR